MRIDKHGKIHTLEEDIVETWNKHNLRVNKIIVNGKGWRIYAESKKPFETLGKYEIKKVMKCRKRKN